MRGLYAIVDVETLERRGLEPVPFAEAVLAAHPAALQLRDKAGGARRTLELLCAIAPLARKASVPFFANDRPDLALLARCDGVHVGQDDVPPSLVRKVAPSLRVGLSTHDEEQIDRALTEAATMGDTPMPPLDYLAIGPIFDTKSKDRPSPVVGLDRLATWAKRARAARPKTPIVAIGGITLETARAVFAHADAIAVIAALLPGPSESYAAVTERARAFVMALAERGGVQ